MYLIQLQYKNSVYRYPKKIPENELMDILTLYKSDKKTVNLLKNTLDSIYNKKNTECYLCVENKDELCLLLIDKFIINYFGDTYSSKNGFGNDFPNSNGATKYLESITKKLIIFNIDNIVDEITYKINNKSLQYIIFENKNIYDDNF